MKEFYVYEREGDGAIIIFWRYANAPMVQVCNNDMQEIDCFHVYGKNYEEFQEYCREWAEQE